LDALGANILTYLRMNFSSPDRSSFFDPINSRGTGVVKKVPGRYAVYFSWFGQPGRSVSAATSSSTIHSQLSYLSNGRSLGRKQNEQSPQHLHFGIVLRKAADGMQGQEHFSMLNL
jgi:hypothetical protein